MKDFDTSEDRKVSKEEFFHGILNWLKEAGIYGIKSGPDNRTMKGLGDYHGVSCLPELFCVYISFCTCLTTS